MSRASKSSAAHRRGLAGVTERLREMFGAMTARPLPDDMIDLVDQLEAQSEPPARPDPAKPEIDVVKACLSPA